MAAIPLAVIGGSGFYEMPGLEAVETVTISTPFGPTSDPIRIGKLAGQPVAFLARHGTGHRLLPSELPQRANFWALKQLGVERVLAVSAVGSLREEYRPGDMVVPDQLIDRTLGARPSTFFGDGIVAHVAMADPFCPRMRAAALEAGRAAGGTVHDGGTYVVIEGPAFGTRAESHLYRSWGASIVGMTALPEAKLAREAELCYAVLASVTDYDSWHQEERPVDAATVLRVLRENVERSQAAVRWLAAHLPPRDCECGRALDAAVVTPPESIPPGTRERLEPILRRWLGERTP
ncbi:MAG: S-methyl-5'-thioadenosine phosphorylase [Chloroflexota bacterium]|nr:S-methyl-5'-thioadenosine phosphorylase [Dehalococcoidia bacterium]MDW8045791.1 S-methyl-5'-thioadenosine phosphorylase [Chloroflexota bacterium]